MCGGEALRARGAGGEAAQRLRQRLPFVGGHRRLQRVGDQVDGAGIVRLQHAGARLLGEVGVEAPRGEAQQFDRCAFAGGERHLHHRLALLGLGLRVHRLDGLAVAAVGALEAFAQRPVALDHRRGLDRALLDAVADRVEHRLGVPRVEDVVDLAAVELDHDVPRRDALPVEELRIHDRLQRHVLAAGDVAQARAGNAAAFVVVVARVVAVDRRDDAHVRFPQLGDLGVAVAHAGVVLAGDLAVHVDAHQDRALGLLGQPHRVVPRALPADRHRLGPVRGSGGVPHLLWHEALRLRDAFLRHGPRRTQQYGEHQAIGTHGAHHTGLVQGARVAASSEIRAAGPAAPRRPPVARARCAPRRRRP